MWVPTDYQRKMLETVFSMSRDALLGDGPSNVATYISNLRNAAMLLENDMVANARDPQKNGAVGR